MTTPDDNTESMHAQLLAFRLNSMPSFEALVREYCKGGEIAEEVALILEDIGQDFVYLSEVVNHEIKRRRDTEGSHK